MLRSCARTAALAGGIAAFWVAQPTRAPAQGLDLRLRQGYDTNVFQAATAVDSVRLEGHYSRVRAGYELGPAREGLSFFFHPEAEVKWYPQASSANQYGAEVQLGLRNQWENPRAKIRDWILETITTLELSGGYERALFVRRQTREEFQEGDPISVASLPVTQMPSRAELAGELRVESEIRDGLTLEGGAAFGWTDYTDGGDSVARSF